MGDGLVVHFVDTVNHHGALLEWNSFLSHPRHSSAGGVKDGFDVLVPVMACVPTRMNGVAHTGDKADSRSVQLMFKQVFPAGGHNEDLLKITSHARIVENYKKPAIIPIVFRAAREEKRAMTPSLQGNRIVFTGKQQLHLEAYQPDEPGEGTVCIRTVFSQMSTGTENTVLSRNFAPGTHWDGWVKYPFYPGYAAVGMIESVGAGVTTLKPGDRVVWRGKHMAYELQPANAAFPIPSEIPWTEAVWYALAKIAFQGARAAQYFLGDTVLIIGAGPIGQMSIRWARAAGATSIIVVDPVADRMHFAERGGATATIVSPIEEARDAVMAANGGVLPRVVIDTTGHWSVLPSALSLADNFGTVVILGDTGEPSKQVLTPDVIRRGLRVVGAHDAHNNDQWNNASIASVFMTLVRQKRFDVSDLITHTFRPSQCEEAYATATRERSSTMGILFSWLE